MFIKEDVHIELISMSSLIAEIPNSNPFSAPGGYFEPLSNQIITLCKSGNADLLTTIHPSSTNPFDVPENYFNTLTADIIEKTKKHQSRIIPIKYFYKSLAAAIIIGCIGFALFSLTKSSKAQEKQEDEITLAIKAANDILVNDRFNGELNALSEKDASDYLLAQGDDIDAALVASLCEDNSLPNEDQILYEPSVFDSCVHELNIQNKHEL